MYPSDQTEYTVGESITVWTNTQTTPRSNFSDDNVEHTVVLAEASGDDDEATDDGAQTLAAAVATVTLIATLF